MRRPTATFIRAMMMETVSPSETSINFNETTRHSIPDDSHLHSRRIRLFFLLAFNVFFLFVFLFIVFLSIPYTSCLRTVYMWRSEPTGPVIYVRSAVGWSCRKGVGECKTPNTSEVNELNKVQYSYGMFPFDWQLVYTTVLHDQSSCR
jgi:hypothetical protein